MKNYEKYSWSKGINAIDLQNLRLLVEKYTLTGFSSEYITDAIIDFCDEIMVGECEHIESLESVAKTIQQVLKELDIETKIISGKYHTIKFISSN